MEYLNNYIFSTKPSHCSFRFLPATREMCCYNAVIADARVPSASDIQALCSILSPELALPSGSHASTTRSHGALHILGTTTSFYLSFTLFDVQFTALSCQAGSQNLSGVKSLDGRTFNAC